MKIEREWYIVRDIRYMQYDGYHNRFKYEKFGKHQTLEEARRAVDEWNENAVEENKCGFQWMITKVTWYLEKDKHGMFIGSMTKEEFIELRDEEDLKEN